MQYAADINSALEATLDAAVEMLGAKMGNIQLLDSETGSLRIVVHRGLNDRIMGHFRDVALTPGTACYQSLQTQKPVIIHDIQADPAYANWRDEISQIGYRGVHCTPLIDRYGVLLGIFTTHFAEPYDPPPVQIRVHELYAHQAVEAMVAGRIAKAAMRSMGFLKFLNELNEAIRDLEDVNEIMTVVTRELGDIFDADQCRFEEVLERDGVLILVNGRSTAPLGPTAESPLEQLGKKAISILNTGRAFTITDMAKVPEKQLSDAKFDSDAQAVMICPVIKRGRPVSLLTIQQRVPKTWLPDEISLVQQVADRAWSQIERGRVTRELRESEIRHRTFLTTVPTAVWVNDGRGSMTHANESWSKYTGQSLEDYKGWGWLNAVHPDDRASVEKNWKDSIAKASSYFAEFRLRRHDGMYRHVTARSAPIIEENGVVREWVGICDDIHQQVLSESRNRFLIALDDALRAEADSREMTQIAARLLGQFLSASRCGYSDVETDLETFNLIGDFNLGVPSLVGRYQLKDFGEVFKESLLNGQEFVVNDTEADECCRPALTAYRQAQIRSIICVPLLKSGRLTAMIMVHQTEPRVWLREEVELVRQVTARCWESIERAHISQELRKNEYRLRLAQRAGRIGSFEWLIPENRFIWSAELRSLFGKPAQEFESTLEEGTACFAPEDAQRITKQIRSTLRAGETEIAFEFRANVSEHSQRWLRGQAIILYDSAGIPRKMIGVNIDIDGQKRAADELRDADRRKDEFLATLAHELRNPLAPIRNAIEILQLGDNSPESIKEMHDAIDRQVQQLVRLVDDLLDVSRITRGKLELRPSIVLLADVLHNAIETSEPVIQTAGQHLTVSIPDDRIWLEADQTRLAQVFSNLLNNAAKYSEANGEIRVHVELHGDRVTVHVTDNGMGIPPEMHSIIFEPFTQVDRTVSRSRGGLGIGLTLVKRLVELHGGSVSVSCDHGTTFSVELPTCPAPKVADRFRSSQPSDSSIPRKRILVVDDTPMALYMVGKLLEKIGQTVYTAQSAQEALELALRHQPDIVISDIGMPMVDGYQLAAMFKAQPKLRRVKLVALTGYGQESDRMNALAAGFDQHLVKPVSLDALRSLLRDPAHSLDGNLTKQ